MIPTITPLSPAVSRPIDIMLTRSSGLSLIVNDNAKIGTSLMVYVIPQIIYVI